MAPSLPCAAIVSGFHADTHPRHPFLITDYLSLITSYPLLITDYASLITHYSHVLHPERHPLSPLFEQPRLAAGGDRSAGALRSDLLQRCHIVLAVGRGRARPHHSGCYRVADLEKAGRAICRALQARAGAGHRAARDRLAVLCHGPIRGYRAVRNRRADAYPRRRSVGDARLARIACFVVSDFFRRIHGAAAGNIYRCIDGPTQATRLGRSPSRFSTPPAIPSRATASC